MNEVLIIMFYCRLLFCKTGGRNLQEFCRRAFPEVIYDDVAFQCNLTGRNGKEALQNTNAFDIFCRKFFT